MGYSSFGAWPDFTSGGKGLDLNSERSEFRYNSFRIKNLTWRSWRHVLPDYFLLITVQLLTENLGTPGCTNKKLKKVLEISAGFRNEVNYFS